MSSRPHREEPRSSQAQPPPEGKTASDSTAEPRFFLHHAMQTRRQQQSGTAHDLGSGGRTATKAANTTAPTTSHPKATVHSPRASAPRAKEQVSATRVETKPLYTLGRLSTRSPQGGAEGAVGPHHSQPPPAVRTALTGAGAKDKITVDGGSLSRNTSLYDKANTSQGLLDGLKRRQDGGPIAGPPSPQTVDPATPSAATDPATSSVYTSVLSRSLQREAGGDATREADEDKEEVPVFLQAASNDNALPPGHQAALQHLSSNTSAGGSNRRGGASKEPLDDRAEVLPPDAVGLEPLLVEYMPKGRCVVFNLLTSWGDPHEIGLGGIELFNDHGERIVPSSLMMTSSTNPDSARGGQETSPRRVHAQEMSIDRNMVSLNYVTEDGSLRLLSEYSATMEEIDSTPARLETLRCDPRRQLSSIINGRHNTHDESKMLAFPYTPGHHHLLCFMFAHPITLSMIRVYNYCGNGRAHASKGTRIMEVTVDDVAIFRGEIAEHGGDLLTLPEDASVDDPATLASAGVINCENILFTEDQAVLGRIMAETQAAFRAELVGDDAEGVHGDLPSPPAAPSGTRESPNLPGSRRAGTSRSARVPPTVVPVSVVLRSIRDDDSDEDTRSSTSNSIGGLAMRPSSHYASRPGISSRGGGGPSAAAAAASAGVAVVPSDKGGAGGNLDPLPSQRRGSAPHFMSHQRAPGTHATTTAKNPTPSDVSGWLGDGATAGRGAEGATSTRSKRVAMYPSCCPRHVQSVCLMLLATWGDVSNIGLSGLRFRDGQGDLIKEPIEHWFVQYPSQQAPLSFTTMDETLSHLFDEDPNTAALLPFELGLQLIFVFKRPVESLGFLEVANYSVGDKTFSGVKEARLFLCSSTGSLQSNHSATSNRPSYCPPAVRELYRHLWSVGDSKASRSILQSGRVMEVTPAEGVSLRKAPARLVQSRFQTYDLSLQAPDQDGFDMDSQSRSGIPTIAPIGIGPGTGGASSGGSATASPGLGFFNATSGATFSNSLSASMNIRAAMAMKRARMMLRDRPDWLLDYQPYITPLLPVGYVCKVRLHLCARRVGGAALAATVATAATDRPPSASPAMSAEDSMKQYVKDWALKPFRSCSFVNENGAVIKPLRPGRSPAPVPENDDDDDEDDSNSVPMVAESILTYYNEPRTDHVAQSPYSSLSPLQMTVELVYVADIPFGLSLLTLNLPLVLPGSAAWVKSVQVRIDDAMIFDSGEASLEVVKGSSHREGSSTPTGQLGSSITSIGSAACVALPKCRTSLKPYVIFTLDSNILDEVHQEVLGPRGS